MAASTVRLVWLCSLFSILIAGCDSGAIGQDDGIQLRTEKGSFESGELVRARITNNSESVISFGACIDSIETLSGREWTTVYRFDICTKQLISLRPGEDHSFDVSMQGIPEADRYRFAYMISVDDQSELFRSNVFEID